ncbi:ribonuclease H-like domain-containing protein [Tanacetum coccineum]
MNAEIKVLNKNQTWIITDLPANRKAIGNKWIFKIKYKASGDIDRYKARLVAKGFNQREGIDFDETFSLDVKLYIVRCLIALFVSNNWPLFQLDVNNAFFYGELDEDVYMTISQGFANKYNKNKVCKLVKSFYGLKQAPRKWNEKLVTVLKENDFVQSENNLSLFTKSKNNKFIALLVYVDDIVVARNSMNEIESFKAFLKSKFNIKDLACEIIWIQKLLFDLKTKVTLLVDLFCDNKSALQLAVNPVFHERALGLASSKKFRYFNHIAASDEWFTFSIRSKREHIGLVDIMKEHTVYDQNFPEVVLVAAEMSINWPHDGFRPCFLEGENDVGLISYLTQPNSHRTIRVGEERILVATRVVDVSLGMGEMGDNVIIPLRTCNHNAREADPRISSSSGVINKRPHVASNEGLLGGGVKVGHD